MTFQTFPLGVRLWLLIAFALPFGSGYGLALSLGVSIRG